jgi:hypothetical protein
MQRVANKCRKLWRVTGFDLLVEESFCQARETLKFLQSAGPAKRSLLPEDILDRWHESVYIRWAMALKPV